MTAELMPDGPSVTRLRFERTSDGLVTGTPTPSVSWITATAARNWRQASYEIEVTTDDGTPFWSTGRVDSDQSVFVPWDGPPLRSRQRCVARVRVWGTDGGVSGWSDPATLEVGLVEPSDWGARFVGPAWDEDLSSMQPCPMLRRDFGVGGGVERARLYVTALGVYEVEINGVRVGDEVLTPGWTSYNHRLRYQAFDVTPLLREGENAIGAILGDGWYRGRIGFGGGQRNIYGEKVALLAQLEVAYADGSTHVVKTDESWRGARSPLLASGIYEGEVYDARLERYGWSRPGYADADWTPVSLVEHDLRTLVAPAGPPVRRTEIVRVRGITRSPSGKTILDFGQNLVGRLRITVSGPAGTTITMRHAEVLEDGELCTRPLRGAQATDRYTLKGGGVEEWEPRFTFHGFRFAEISGWPGEVAPDDVVAVVCHSDMQRTGWFECSDDLINRLHENIVWSTRGNFLDVPTDCPQRDERLGWTGDIQVFAPTACFLFDTAGFLASWLADVAADQLESGIVPFVVPNVLPMPAIPTAAWGDAAVIVPWTLYQRFGDRDILASQYGSMRAWVDHIAGLAAERRLWDRGFQFGDWLDPSAPPDRPAEARTDRYLVATAYFARSTELLARAAGVLGHEDDAARYRRLAEEVKAAFCNEFVAPSGRMVSDSQTGYALALQFGLLPNAEQRRRAGDQLARLVRSAGFHIATGFVGTPLICDALCDAGHIDTAFRLLTETTCPSWLYPVTMGATTIWERWDSIRPDGSVNPGEMTSFNHYAFGAVGDWLHRTVGGLAPTAPGYCRIAIHPRPGGGLTWARSRHRTPYGMAEVSWRIEGSTVEVQALVPPNTTAEVFLPGAGGEPLEVGAGEYRWQCGLEALTLE